MRTVLQDYDVVSQVPKPGGMGLVYRARRKSGELIALKVIPLSGNREADATARSERRGAAVQQLLAERDRHVPRVYAFGEKHGVFFIEMEFIEGEDLSTILGRSGTMPPREAARIALEIASFLHVAHAMHYGRIHLKPAKLVHADLKPSNIRIATTGDVKILDFGIARAGWQTQTFKQFGSVPYMSPERIEGQIDRHADYWALGVVLYEMLAGRPPVLLTGTPSRSQAERMIVSRRPPPPLPSSTPATLQAIVRTMLHGDLAARFATAAEIKTELSRFLHGKPATESRPRPAVSRVVSRLPRGIGARIAALAAVGFALNAYTVGCAAGHLRDDLTHAPSIDPDAVWARYERIQRWSVIPFGTSELRASVAHSLVAKADAVMATFRREQVVVRESSWRAARDWLRKAVALDDSPQIRSRLLCAEGHLLRIDGQFDQAAKLFDEAVRLNARSPDPYLGLARIHRTLAERARSATAAAAEYEQALAFYERAAGFGADAGNVRQVRSRLAQLRSRETR